MPEPDVKADASDLAAALGIPPQTFAGQEARAFVAMGLLTKAPRLTQTERDELLRAIDREFSTMAPAFPLACSSAMSVFVANPDWSITEASNTACCGG